MQRLEFSNSYGNGCRQLLYANGHHAALLIFQGMDASGKDGAIRNVLQYVNPATGGSSLPTIAAFLQLLPRGFSGAGYRSTDSTIYSVVEGRGTSRIGDMSLSWAPKDVFVVPSWMPVSHETDEDAVLFSASDRPVQKALGMWRDELIVQTP